jgi:AraC family transcriptional regulator
LRETEVDVWDGKRPRLRRKIVARRDVRIGQIAVTLATENLAQATDWALNERHNSIVIHLGGELTRMEYEFSRGPSGSAIPSPGDIWMISAGCRYAALAQGSQASFVELGIPTALLADGHLPSRVQHRDDFLSRAAARLASLLSDASNDLSQMAARQIIDALHQYLLNQFGPGRRPLASQRLSSSKRIALVDAIHSQLGSPQSLSGLATLVGMDVRRFTDAFSHAFGLTPWQYVLRARVEEAARLLRHTDHMATDIALSVGFASPSHLTTAFNRQLGTTPSRYRSEAQG